MTLQFKRQSAGSYVAVSPAGNIEVNKIDDKWYISFPDGKKSYRRSYDAAKKWASEYISRLKSTPVSCTSGKSKSAKKEAGKSKISKSKQTPSLREKLKPNYAYVVGAEWFGCVNTGRRACILHFSINEISYYAVGYDGQVTDTLFEKPMCRIIGKIKAGVAIREYECRNGSQIKVFKSFKEAEKCYRTLDGVTNESNHQAQLKVQEARKQINGINNTSAKAGFVLADYGLI